MHTVRPSRQRHVHPIIDNHTHPTTSTSTTSTTSGVRQFHQSGCAFQQLAPFQRFFTQLQTIGPAVKASLGHILPG